ncbi:MAG: hypothetical protein WAT23_19035 [Chromatiaceae bacterium]
MGKSPNTWRSIPALAERCNAGAAKPTFTSHALRHLVRNANRNGLAPHIRRIGRKILIDETGFLAWLDGKEIA